MNIFSVPYNKKAVSVISQKFINVIASLALLVSPLSAIAFYEIASAAPDTTGPVLTKIFPFDDQHINGNQTFHLSATDNGVDDTGVDASTVTMRLWDGGANDSGVLLLSVLDLSQPNKYSRQYQTANLPDGSGYQVDFYAEDNAGNSSSLTVNNITIDNTEPTGVLTAPNDGDVVNGTLDIRGSGNDININKYQITVRDSSNTLVRNIVTNVLGNFTDELLYQLDTFTLPNGNYTVRLHVYDKAGNGPGGNKNARTANITISNSIPVITVNSLTTTSVSPELTGTVDDTTATVSVNVNGTDYPATNNGDGTWTLPAGTISPDLAVGVYDVAASATNTQGTGVDVTVNELTVEVVPTPGPNPGPTPTPGPGGSGGGGGGSSSTRDPSVVATFNNSDADTSPGVDVNSTESDESDSGTGEVSSTDSDQTNGEVKADTDTKPNWFINLLKWLIPLLLLLLFLFLLFKRRKKDEEEN